MLKLPVFIYAYDIMKRNLNFAIIEILKFVNLINKINTAFNEVRQLFTF